LALLTVLTLLYSNCIWQEYCRGSLCDKQNYAGSYQSFKMCLIILVSIVY